MLRFWLTIPLRLLLKFLFFQKHQKKARTNWTKDCSRMLCCSHYKINRTQTTNVLPILRHFMRARSYRWLEWQRDVCVLECQRITKHRLQSKKGARNTLTTTTTTKRETFSRNFFFCVLSNYFTCLEMTFDNNFLFFF